MLQSNVNGCMQDSVHRRMGLHIDIQFIYFIEVIVQGAGLGCREHA